MTELMNRGKAAQGLKFGFAALAAAALVIGGVSPASAASTQLGPDAIAGFENGDETGTAGYNYDQWHIGNTEGDSLTSEDSLEFGKCSVTVLAPVEGSVTQVLKGFPIDARPSAPAEIRALIESIKIDVASGDVTLQIPVFLYPEEDADPVFTTFRNAQNFTTPGVHSLGMDTLLTESAEGSQLTVGELLELLEFFSQQGVVVEVLGVGFTGAEGTVVNSIEFGGSAYTFGTGCAAAPGKPKPPVTVQTGIKDA